MENPKTSFVVSCVGCQRMLMTVDRIRDAEIRALKDHLRGCLQLEAVGAFALGAVMDRIHVAVKSVRSPAGSTGTGAG